MTHHRESVAPQLLRAGVTEREAEVLSALAERLRNREIAARLHLSMRTVESHVAALLRKLAISIGRSWPNSACSCDERPAPTRLCPHR